MCHSRSAQSFAEVFKGCRIFLRYVCEVVETFLYPGRQTCCGDIVAQNSTIHNLSEKRRLRDQLLHQVRNIPVPPVQRSLHPGLRHQK